MVALTFPDGVCREFPAGISGLDIAKGISPSLAKRTVAMALDGVVTDLADPITGDAKIEFLNREDPRALELIRHDAAHVLAEAVQALWPGTQVTIGPVIAGDDAERLVASGRCGGRGEVACAIAEEERGVVAAGVGDDEIGFAVPVPIAGGDADRGAAGGGGAGGGEGAIAVAEEDGNGVGAGVDDGEVRTAIAVEVRGGEGERDGAGGGGGCRGRGRRRRRRCRGGW